MNGRKNYLVIVFGSAIVQYALPFVAMIILAPIVVGNIIAVGAIEFLKALNPFFVAMYLPVAFVDAALIGVLLICLLFCTGVFWYYFYRQVGTFMVFPILIWLVAVGVWFIPIIGPVASILITAFPWLPLFGAMHYLAYH